jgi:uncharacterized membrane protein
MQIIPKRLLLVFAAIAFIGFVDAMFLSANDLSGNVPPCLIAGGCEQVTTSVYSRIAGIPIAIFGTLYYVTLFALMLGYIEKGKSILIKLAALITTLGFIFTLWLVYAQLFLIHAICEYCLVSAGSTTILFILSWYFVRRLKKESQSISIQVEN